MFNSSFFPVSKILQLLNKILMLERGLQKSNYIFLFRTFQNGYIMYSENVAHLYESGLWYVFHIWQERIAVPNK